MAGDDNRLKIAIVGASGRLGAALARHFGRRAKVVTWNRDVLDLRDTDAIRSALGSASFDVLINSAALTAVDYCETHREEAMTINGAAVAAMAETCAGKRARLVHISTDYVFDGKQREPYRETDTAKPISVYGESKLAGEQAALAASGRNLVVRVSWVYGPDRPAFPDMIIQRALENDHVEAISDKVSTPASTVELAGGIESLIGVEASGLVHLCDGGSCTWQEYGQGALDAAVEAGLPLKTRTVGAIKLADLSAFVAKRPVHTALSTARFTKLTGLRPRPWPDPLREFVQTLALSARERTL